MPYLALFSAVTLHPSRPPHRRMHLRFAHRRVASSWRSSHASVLQFSSMSLECDWAMPRCVEDVRTCCATAPQWISLTRTEILPPIAKSDIRVHICIPDRSLLSFPSEFPDKQHFNLKQLPTDTSPFLPTSTSKNSHRPSTCTSSPSSSPPSRPSPSASPPPPRPSPTSRSPSRAS
ncbi:uncharacterized protein K489DRAFT_210261 [Dissoconium aciculare CBS 342.82]|jgi:hypothetical protein|uniref:Uncharacterized protein n=1 Tax=Dissoconium aciculare CBS 342.82 TaxID=1314786 RepID=A0A6J3M735_9PEZI|nr:uncharacterized protein K489DRAFT_210261 [Dissoconium aciculare CBS 342.82]KAF1823881.1 hypothetical protein K489DRAFT_210261 [Dissoconium aciculare CBS 342.82]